MPQRSSALAARVGEDGVLAFCRRPVVRGRPNERFLNNTLRGVFTTNRRVDEQLLWDTRNQQREREERERGGKRGSRGASIKEEDRKYGSEDDGGLESRERRHQGKERGERGRERRENCRSPDARREEKHRKRGRSQMQTDEHSSKKEQQRQSSSTKAPRMGSPSSSSLCKHSAQPGLSSASTERHSHKRSGSPPSSFPPSSPSTSAGASGGVPEASGSLSRGEGDSEKRRVAEEQEEAGWAPMSDEEMQRMLGSYKVRGSGGVGSQIDLSGPYLHPEARPRLEGVPRGPAVPLTIRQQQQEQQEGGFDAARELLDQDPGLAKIVKKLAKQQAELDAAAASQRPDGGKMRKKKKREKKEKKKKKKSKSKMRSKDEGGKEKKGRRRKEKRGQRESRSGSSSEGSSVSNSP
jgi:hypothetical protein